MWEYKIVKLPNPGQAQKMDDLPGLQEDAERLLNELGAKGWEIIGNAGYTIFLKRRKEDDDVEAEYEYDPHDKKWVRIDD